jgi:hypothetical protein
MELRLGSHAFSIGDFIIYVADAGADAVLPESAQVAEVAPDPELVTRIRTEHPGLVIAVAAPTPALAYACVEAGAALLVGDHLATVAAATGSGLVSREPARAASQGVRPDRLIVEARSIADAEESVRTGHAVLVTPGSASGVSCPSTQEPDAPAPLAADAAAVAEVAVYAWTGAQIFRVPACDATATREALDMVASIKGNRPPSVSRRGLV